MATTSSSRNSARHKAKWSSLRPKTAKQRLKYWFPEKNRIRLQPANSEYGPIYTKDARVIGVVVGVVREV